VRCAAVHGKVSYAHGGLASKRVVARGPRFNACVHSFYGRSRITDARPVRRFEAAGFE
jgi:hypothetical protein